MAFDAPFLTLAGLIEITLPSATLRLCDGAYVKWGSDTFASADADFGTVESVESLGEGVGDEAPGGRLTFLPASTTAAAVLSQPSYQRSSMRFWLAEVDPATGIVSGTPELMFDGELDTTELRLARGSRKLDVGFISIAERLFQINEGNTLSPRAHKAVWPGETGLDNATGVGLSVAWGIEGPPRAYNYSGAGGGGTGSLSGSAGSFGGGGGGGGGGGAYSVNTGGYGGGSNVDSY